MLVNQIKFQHADEDLPRRSGLTRLDSGASWAPQGLFQRNPRASAQVLSHEKHDRPQSGSCSDTWECGREIAGLLKALEGIVMPRLGLGIGKPDGLRPRRVLVGETLQGAAFATLRVSLKIRSWLRCLAASQVGLCPANGSISAQQLIQCQCQHL